MYSEKFIETVRIPLLAGERLWGGRVTDGIHMPYKPGFEADLIDPHGNQVSYLLVSSRGRVVWSDAPFYFKVGENELTVSARDTLSRRFAGETLASALEFARRTVFPRPEGLIAPEDMFTAPQFNTWIELIYNQNQAGILDYAENIVKCGYKPGVLMIDNGWQENYGVWRFHGGRFPDPHGMMNRLHELGFKVVLWVVPFVTADTVTFQLMRRKDNTLFARTQSGEPAIVKWWEGYSALLDFSNPAAMDWMRGELKYLQDEYGVDGFKFDAGAPSFYSPEYVYFEPGCSGDRQTRLFCELAAEYPYSELRECASEPQLTCAQRLRDKAPAWNGGEGLDALIPDTLAQGVTGYFDVCPDMIGGGEYSHFMYGDLQLDEELFVRWAQCSALLPMMQFSAAPWRVLSEKAAKLCVQAAALHDRFAPYILKLVKSAHATGLPAVCPMEALFPGRGYEEITNQFMLGRDMLVAPVVDKGYGTMNVVLPEGAWRADDGTLYEGGRSVTIDTPLERLPYFIREGAEVEA